ncbi:D-methionine ABC transporter ATP-binding protein MetN [Gottschalkia purinilytica]|uniref:D-methionine ABC transporter ATP-binding protein MetN n=1 Tax=Gottschalkia purinilytica TaxID=1503 RepID=A0A0L0WCD6_GOTPU|nr:methionine ABC transporter ATP-binding protein [Gottschalkia purinilytica]KNF09070.1 D-methionine ABC transporter ATP-binding protein MetN [Gottschalkia purinilytica]
MIHIKNVTKSFGDIKVLDRVSLNIRKGTIFGLVGRSGTGKSTLLRCINGIETYDTGSVIVDGVDVKSLKNKEVREFRKNIGMIFQNFSLLERMTVYENIALPLKCWKYKRSFIDHRVKELAEIVELGGKLDAKPKELSGGQKQRVAIARAIAMDPKILLCDEATSALDPKTAQSVTTLLNQINKDFGITILVVTHQMSVLQSCCEEIAILEDGAIAEVGNIEDIFLQQPNALINLIGQKDLPQLDSGINMKVLLSSEHSSKPIITQMARELEIDFKILGGDMENYRNDILGSIIINVQSKDLPKIAQYLKDKTVQWNLIEEGREIGKGVDESC